MSRSTLPLPTLDHTRPGDDDSWAAFADQCLKPGSRDIGVWHARRLARPLALRITWLVAPTGISAHAVTLAALATAFAASVVAGQGTSAGLIVATILWAVWYLLDHVDGQIARLRGTASLDGVQLDYLMHHLVNLLLPGGLGWGLFARDASAAWLLVGAAWGLATLVLGLEHDTRFKAFEQRWKRLSGELYLIGGGGGRPAPAPRPAWRAGALAAWAAKKATESHVILTCLAAIALATAILGGAGWHALRVYVAAMALLSAATAIGRIARGLRHEATEQAFAAWFRVPEGHALVHDRGDWRVERDHDSPSKSAEPTRTMVAPSSIATS